MDIPKDFYLLWEYHQGKGGGNLCAYISRVERKKEHRKKMFFWSFIIADILIGVWIGISIFNSLTYIGEGEITPKEKLQKVDGMVTGWEYVLIPGTKYHSSKHYFSIELDNEETYKIESGTLEVFDRERFMASGKGSHVILLLDDNRGYKGREGRVEIAEVWSENTCYLKYEDFKNKKQEEKKLSLKTRLPMSLLGFLLIDWPLLYLIYGWLKKRKKHRISLYRIKM